ncbi:hypothetical protein OUZ56_030029 [Daphnia magna]|uniref:Uncharacterized protein n=1 Tax=Daphnia magna TaxID=35525 RepID=A0ABQ9ZRD8_9CRUS|nr:hypothetical protein OUZ56_030029 [Daphnia magna]
MLLDKPMQTLFEKCLYPLNKSSVGKYFEPHNASTVSSVLAYYQSSILPRSTQTLINWCASSLNGSSSSSKLDKGLSGIFIPISEKVMLYNGNILSEKLCSTP